MNWKKHKKLTSIRSFVIGQFKTACYWPDRLIYIPNDKDWGGFKLYYRQALSATGRPCGSISHQRRTKFSHLYKGPFTRLMLSTTGRKTKKLWLLRLWPSLALLTLRQTPRWLIALVSRSAAVALWSTGAWLIAHLPRSLGRSRHTRGKMPSPRMLMVSGSKKATCSWNVL